MGNNFVCTKLSLIVFPAETLNSSHASTNIEFMWRDNFLLCYNSASRTPCHYYKDTSVLHWGHCCWAVATGVNRLQDKWLDVLVL